MKIKLGFALFLIIILTVTTSLPSFANSAQQHWYGIDTTGAVVVGDSSPIIVKNESLTFDLPEFPSNYYASEEDFLNYAGKVTAEYTFYNPSDMTVTATLAFPFGNLPSYAYGQDDSDTQKYEISVNGKEIKSTVRHTFSDSSKEFDLSTDMSLISDGYVSDEFYKPDLTVTVYKWSVSGISYDSKQSAHAACDIQKNGGERVFYFPEQNSGHIQEDGSFRVGKFTKNGDSIELYVIGKPLEILPIWTIYKNGGAEDGDQISGRVNYEGAETMRFNDIVFGNYDEESGISEADWYNAVLADIKSENKYNGFPIVNISGASSNFAASLMRWYVYEITLEAGESIVNSVTAPIYPSIDMTYSPSVYEYTYLLSPAGSWKNFGNLEILINTPYYLTDCTLGAAEKTEGGYKFILSGLPRNDEGEYEELIFNLSTEAEPVLKSKASGGIVKNLIYLIAYGLAIVARVILVAAGVFLAVAAVVAIVIAIIFIIKKLKKK